MACFFVWFKIECNQYCNCKIKLGYSNFITLVLPNLIIMKKLLSISVLICSMQFSKSQELESILLAADDASLLTQSYLNPAVKGLMYSINGGWYTTGKVHKKFGFDITISGNASLVPNSDQFFRYIASDYNFLELPNGESQIPTLMSESTLETAVDIRIPNDDGSFKVASFNMPGGIGADLPLNAVPAPMVQIGLGLPTNTDIKVRFVPNIAYSEDMKSELIGIGLQHDITQYLGPIEKLPLNISVLGAFTSLIASYKINSADFTDNVSVNNGEAEFKLNAYTIQAIASLDFKLITLYGSLGYNGGATTAKMKGNYTLTYDLEDSNGNTIGTVNESIVDPLNLGFNINGMRATLGTRLNFGFFKIFADYSLQEFNTISAGIALSFR